MSKFIDRLKQLSEGSPQPIGFRLGAKAPSRLRIQLIGRLSKHQLTIKEEDISETDAVILARDENLTTEIQSFLKKTLQGNQ